MSNGKWIYVMFMILMITSHTRTDDDATTDELPKLKVYHPPKDKICAKELHTFIDLNTTIESYILVMGKTKKRVLLITKSLFVYDVPHDFFDPVGVAVYLKYMPTPMKDKYPVLYYDPLFQSIKNEISAWITYDSDGDWICMTSNDSKQGINYNIDKSEVHKGFVLSGEWPETLIPTQEPCKFYSIQRRIDKVNIISTTKTALWLTVYKCKNGDRIINSNGIEKVTDFRMLCYNGFDVWITKGKKCERYRALEWPFGSGFVCDGKFFIIGVVAVYVLSENLFNQAGKSFPGGEYYPHHFYNCTGIIPPNKVIFKSYFYWIIAAIILLVIIISSVYVAHRSLANRKKTRSGLERSSKISLSKSSIKVASKRSLKSKSKSKTSRIKSSSSKNTSKSGRVGSRTSLSGILRKATSPGSRKSLSGRLKKTTSLGSRTSLFRRSRKTTSPGSRTSGRSRKAASPSGRTSLSGRSEKATSPGSRTSLSRRSRKATSPGSRTSLSGRLRRATYQASRTSLKGRSSRPTSPMSKMSSKISLNRLKRSKSRLNSISRGGSTSKLASLIKHIS